MFAAISVLHAHAPWLPIALGVAGALLLFHASVLLIAESRLALQTVDDEMNFVWRVGQHYAPDEPLA